MSSPFGGRTTEEIAFVERLARARADSALAETDLDAVLRALVAHPRHEKVGVSKLLEAAMTRVRVVRAELAVLEDLVAAELPLAAH